MDKLLNYVLYIFTIRFFIVLSMDKLQYSVVVLILIKLILKD